MPIREQGQLREQRVVQPGEEREEERKTPWWQYLLAPFQPIAELGQAIETVEDIAGPLVAAPFVPEIREKVQKRDVLPTPQSPDPRLQYLYENLAQEEFEELPGAAKFFAERAIALPFYTVGIGGAGKQALEGLSAKVYNVYNNALKKATTSPAGVQALSKVEKAIYDVGQRLTQYGKVPLANIPEEKVLQEVYGTLKMTAGERVAGGAIKETAKQITRSAIPVGAKVIPRWMTTRDPQTSSAFHKLFYEGKGMFGPREIANYLDDATQQAVIDYASSTGTTRVVQSGEPLVVGQKKLWNQVVQGLERNTEHYNALQRYMDRLGVPDQFVVYRGSLQAAKTSGRDYLNVTPQKRIAHEFTTGAARSPQLGDQPGGVVESFVLNKRDIIGLGARGEQEFIVRRQGLTKIDDAFEIVTGERGTVAGQVLTSKFLETGKPFQATVWHGKGPVKVERMIGTEWSHGAGRYFAADMPGAEVGVGQTIAKRYAIGKPTSNLVGKQLDEEVRRLGGKIDEVTVNLRNPYIIDEGGDKVLNSVAERARNRVMKAGGDAVDAEKAAAGAVPKYLKNRGYDGLIVKRDEGYLEVIPYADEAVQRAVPATKKIPAGTPAELVQLALDPQKQAVVKKLTTALRKEVKPFRKEAEELWAIEERRKVAAFYRLRDKYKEQAKAGKMSMEEAYQKADKAYYGKMKAPKWTIGQTLSPEERDVLFEMIDARSFRAFDNKRARDALVKLLDKNEIPHPSELSLLERVFGLEFAKTAIRQLPFSERAMRALFDIFNLPRSVLASFDLSAPLRQGAVLLPGHPKESMQAFKWQMQALRSEKNAIQLNEVLFGRAPGMDEAAVAAAERRFGAGLFMHDLVGISQGLSAREEAFISRFAQRMPILGKGVQLSERAYVTYLNKLRADVFDSIVHGWEVTGKPMRQADLSELARFINRATGRGELWFGEYSRKGAKLLPTPYGGAANLLFFSPRLQTSRFLLPFSMLSSSPAVKRQAMRDIAMFGATASTIVSLLSFHPDVNVELDPRSTDFGRIRVNNTRIDISASTQPYLRLFAQMLPWYGGKRKTSGGRLIPLNRWFTLIHQGRGKLNPVVGELVDQLAGQNFIGEEVWVPGDPWERALTEIFEGFVPMYPQTVKEVVEQEGIVDGIILSFPEFWGATVSSYDSSLYIVGEVRSAYGVAREKQQKYDELLEQGKIEEAQRYAEKNPEMRLTTFLGRAQRRLNEWENRVEELMEDGSIPAETRDKLIEELTRNIISYAQDILLEVDGLPNNETLNDISNGMRDVQDIIDAHKAYK